MRASFATVWREIRRCALVELAWWMLIVVPKDDASTIVAIRVLLSAMREDDK